MISLKNVVLRRGAKVLLDRANATLNPGEKVGLVGRNGAGKSTLFALFNGSLHEDGGEFSVPSQWRLAQVAQDMPETTQGATHYVIEGDTHLLAAQAEVEAANDSGDGDRIAHAYMHLYDAGEHDAKSRAQALILGLGFQVAELDKPVNSFSGGWRMRLQLARYGGNYSSFEDQRAEKMLLQQSAFAKQQEKIAHLQKFISRFKAQASKAKQAQSRVKALDRMEKLAPLLAEADFSFEFKEPANLPNPMLSLQDISVGYPPPEGQTEPTVIVRGISKSVLAGQRIGILGANGQGKSTLVKTIARELAPLAGETTEGKGLNIGYFAQQELDVLRPDDNPLEHMIRLARESTAAGKLSGQETREQSLRNFLGQFNFSGDMVSQTVGSMSGGEKARLVLCMLVWQRPNLLLLDEPTNHLDLATREALSVALNEFEGTVMLVSHDRALLRAVCDEFWMVSRGGVSPFDGDLDDYQRYLLEEAKRQRAAARTAAAAPEVVQTPAPAPKAAAVPSSSLKPLKKEFEQIEQRMAQLNADKDKFEASLAANPSPAEIAEAGRRLKAVSQELDTLEERWLALGEQIETASAA